MSDKYPSLSPYNYCAWNPVMFIDPNGKEIDPTELYKKDDKGNYVYKQQVEAFEAYINTKGGYAEIAKFAKNGQTIAGKTFSKDGNYHNKGIDLVLNGGKDFIKSSEKSGFTKPQIINNRLKISIQTCPLVDIGGGVGTFSHEIFIHAEQYSKDFIDDRVINYSHTYSGLLEYANKIGKEKNTGYIHHWQEINQDRALVKYGIPVMMEYYNKIGKPQNINLYKKSMYEFVK